MSLDKVFALIFSVLGIIFTYWFFLMRQEKEVTVLDVVDIKVEGGYDPEFITIPVGKLTKLNFLRTDPSSCLEEVVLSDFKIKRQLPLNQKVMVEIIPQTKGEYIYSCGMNMFHGKIRVV